MSKVVRASVRSAKPNVRAFARGPCRRPPALRTRAVQAAYKARCCNTPPYTGGLTSGNSEKAVKPPVKPPV